MSLIMDDLKTTLGMETLRCLSPKMVEKELLALLIAHNLLRWVMAQAARELIQVQRHRSHGCVSQLRHRHDTSHID
jgi:hypothetical protein